MAKPNADLDGRTWECVNEPEKFWKYFYLVSLSQHLGWDSAVCVNADNDQDALDAAVDYHEAQGHMGYFVEERDLRRDKDGAEVDMLWAGNHSLAMCVEDVNIRRIPERFVTFPPRKEEAE